ncbi:type IV secretory system conjugative DNA transfer family protein [Sporomusa acidovorans]|uniref:type IV secretory system conjugative DNA transfer family protein n=1 Tax=Sporomusa acidovorans TaxID=112900 RepID=UPI000884A589|nr:type IV secretory system conjugative DNA transfer family protein [Sporomusa acidovorans]OZC19019.1 conjugal transfer protein TraG [Sporomusa acidovorans DSM 3132]SDD73312.1 Type IV secretory system Conjugative DNA transfer [Sporomusa acidovorans]
MEDQKNRRILVLLGTVGFVMLIVCWLTTQWFARRCDYDPLLGWGFLLTDGTKLYLPWDIFIWRWKFSAVVPHLSALAGKYLLLGLLGGVALSFYIETKLRPLDSHGSADWAGRSAIKKSGLCVKEGVVLGRNPFTKKFLFHDGPEHILLLAPTRSGKGVGVIIPTCLVWKHSMLVTDVKAENWNFSAPYRRQVLKNRVIKFEPGCIDGTGARWNPLVEIRYRTVREFGDVQIIADMLANPDGKDISGDGAHWVITASSLMRTVIMHLMYKKHQEGKLPPTMMEVATFLSLPHKAIIAEMKVYPHITPEEFFSETNILDQIYSLPDTPYVDIGNWKRDVADCLKEPEEKRVVEALKTLQDVRAYMKERYSENPEIFTQLPYAELLVHPKVLEGAREMGNREEKEESSVLSSAVKAFLLYRNPVIAKNTGASDFKIADLLRPDYPVSVFLVTAPGDLDTIKPLFRLFMNFVIKRNVEKMDFGSKQKQRCLLLFDEFPQFGRMDSVELGLAVMAGYGLKALLIAQDIHQLDKTYTKDNSIIANCHVRVFYTPNEDGTAEMLSKSLGKKTIRVDSKNSGQGIGTASYTTSETGRDLMTPDEVKRLPKEQELVFVAQTRPILADKLFYFKEKFFMKKIESCGQAQALNLHSDTASVVRSYEDLLPPGMCVPTADYALARQEEIAELEGKQHQLAEWIDFSCEAMKMTDELDEISSVTIEKAEPIVGQETFRFIE